MEEVKEKTSKARVTEKKKPVFYTEWAYVVGLVVIAFSAAVCAKADLGVSMVVAPAFILFRKVSQFLPWFSYGMAEYGIQLIQLLIMLVVLRKFKVSYLFSFVTAIIYGLVLDASRWIISPIDASAMPVRIAMFVFSVIGCAFGVSMMFHTYIAPEVYELIVKEVSEKFHLDINKFKMAYDIGSCVVGVIMSFAFFGFGVFEGVKWGTVITALVNGWIIGLFSKLLEHCFEFRDGTKMRKLFEH